jgi:predicted RNase H-like nuclease (RuvC/YqgF family)
MTASLKTRSPEADASRLDRRREKLQARRVEADLTSQKLSRYAEALESNSTRVSQLEADVAMTRDRLAVLKKSLKNVRKERDKLRNGRKKIRQNAAKAAQRATNAERKYDRSMLADILAREKQHDLSRHAAPATTPTPVKAPPARTATVKAPAATAAKPAESPLHEAPSALGAPPAATPARRQAGAQPRAARRASTTASRTASGRSGGGTRNTRG